MLQVPFVVSLTKILFTIENPLFDIHLRHESEYISTVVMELYANKLWNTFELPAKFWN